MGTSAMIGKIMADGSVKATYCHYDGYVSYMGRLLSQSYNTPKLAETVAETGYLSSLTEDLESSKERSVHKNPPVEYNKAETFLKCGDCRDGANYLYLFDGQDWLVSSTQFRGRDRFWTLVTDVLKKSA